MSQVQRFTFSKEEKLCSRKIIESLFTSGKTINQYPVRLLWQVHQLPTKKSTQVVFVVPKKNFRLATDRNRIKRQMREVFRYQKHLVNETCHKTDKQIAMMLIFSGKKQLPFQETEHKIILILQRLTETLNGNVQ